MSKRAEKKQKPAKSKPADDRTTIRAKVTPDEHEVVEHFAKHRCGTTIELFVRQAVDAYLEKIAKKNLATLAEENRNRGKFIQEELF